MNKTKGLAAYFNEIVEKNRIHGSYKISKEMIHQSNLSEETLDQIMRNELSRVLAFELTKNREQVKGLITASENEMEVTYTADLVVLTVEQIKYIRNIIELMCIFTIQQIQWDSEHKV